MSNFEKTTGNATQLTYAMASPEQQCAHGPAVNVVENAEAKVFQPVLGTDHNSGAGVALGAPPTPLLGALRPIPSGTGEIRDGFFFLFLQNSTHNGSSRVLRQGKSHLCSRRGIGDAASLEHTWITSCALQEPVVLFTLFKTSVKKIQISHRFWESVNTGPLYTSPMYMSVVQR